ncbi:MAG: hypothetical protein WDN72_03645 [Alphaproteobacteria bacterium]
MALLAIPGIAIQVVTAFGLILTMGLTNARYRDLGADHARRLPADADDDAHRLEARHAEEIHLDRRLQPLLPPDRDRARAAAGQRADAAVLRGLARG